MVRVGRPRRDRRGYPRRGWVDRDAIGAGTLGEGGSTETRSARVPSGRVGRSEAIGSGTLGEGRSIGGDRLGYPHRGGVAGSAGPQPFCEATRTFSAIAAKGCVLSRKKTCYAGQLPLMRRPAACRRLTPPRGTCFSLNTSLYLVRRWRSCVVLLMRPSEQRRAHDGLATGDATASRLGPGVFACGVARRAPEAPSLPS